MEDTIEITGMKIIKASDGHLLLDSQGVLLGKYYPIKLKKTCLTTWSLNTNKEK